MSKPLSSYPNGSREVIAHRRIASKTRGLGYWAAAAFLARKGFALGELAETEGAEEITAGHETPVDNRQNHHGALRTGRLSPKPGAKK